MDNVERNDDGDGTKSLSDPDRFEDDCEPLNGNQLPEVFAPSASNSDYMLHLTVDDDDIEQPSQSDTVANPVQQSVATTKNTDDESIALHSTSAECETLTVECEPKCIETTTTTDDDHTLNCCDALLSVKLHLEETLREKRVIKTADFDDRVLEDSCHRKSRATY